MEVYELLWRNKWLTAEAHTIDDMIASLEAAVRDLKQMRDLGVQLEDSSSVSDDYAFLVTNKPELAQRFGMEKREELDEED